MKIQFRSLNLLAHMVVSLLIVCVVAIGEEVVREDASGPAPQRIGQKRGHQNPHHRFAKLDANQKAEFASCLKAKGIAMPKRPKFTREQKAAFESCRAQNPNPDHGVMTTCLQNSGIQFPERQRPAPGDKQVVHGCYQKAVAAAQ